MTVGGLVTEGLVAAAPPLLYRSLLYPYPYAYGYPHP